MDERGAWVPREGARPALWLSDAVATAVGNVGMNGRWTVQRAGSLARGRMKEGQSPLNLNGVPSRPVPRAVSSQGPPATCSGGVSGGRGAPQFSSPLPRSVFGGWPALITGT